MAGEIKSYDDLKKEVDKEENKAKKVALYFENVDVITPREKSVEVLENIFQLAIDDEKAATEFMGFFVAEKLNVLHSYAFPLIKPKYFEEFYNCRPEQYQYIIGNMHSISLQESDQSVIQSFSPFNNALQKFKDLPLRLEEEKKVFGELKQIPDADSLSRYLEKLLHLNYEESIEEKLREVFQACSSHPKLAQALLAGTSIAAIQKIQKLSTTTIINLSHQYPHIAAQVFEEHRFQRAENSFMEELTRELKKARGDIDPKKTHPKIAAIVDIKEEEKDRNHEAYEFVVQAAEALRYTFFHRDVVKEDKELINTALDSLLHVKDLDQAANLMEIKDFIETKSNQFGVKWPRGILCQKTDEKGGALPGSIRVPHRVKKIHDLINQYLKEKDDTKKQMLIREIALAAVDGIKHPRPGQSSGTRIFYQTVLKSFIERKAIKTFGPKKAP